MLHGKGQQRMQKHQENGWTGEQIELVYGYREHFINILYQRLNFFVASESALVAAFALLVSNSSVPTLTRIFLMVLGTVLTLIWYHVQVRAAHIAIDLTRWVQDLLPVYHAIRVREPRDLPRIKYSSVRSLSYTPPLLFLAVWLGYIFLIGGPWWFFITGAILLSAIPWYHWYCYRKVPVQVVEHENENRNFEEEIIESENKNPAES